MLVAAVLAWWKLRSRGDDTEARSGSAGGSTAVSATTGGARAPRIPQAKSTLAGRVVRASDGSAVAGATVALTPKLTLATMIGGGDGGNSDAAELTALTNDKGEFEIEDITPMTYLVTATARGAGTGETEVAVPPGTRVDSVVLTLVAEGVVLKGTVTDVLGGPIVDAKIGVVRSQMRSMGTTDAQLVTSTDERGTYEIVVAIGTYSVDATHDEYAADTKYIDIVEATTLDFTLTPGASIKGTVVTREGAPLPGAKVSVGGAVPGFGKSDATADDSGAFTLRGLEPGALELMARGGDYSSAAPTTVEVGLGEQIDGVQLVVDRGMLVAGRVVEKGTTKGVPGVLVGLFSLAGEGAMATEATDVNGAFEIRGVRPASYIVFAFGDETMPEMGQNVTVADKDITDMLIEIERGVTVRGRVEPPMEASLGLSTPDVSIGNMFAMMKSAMVNAKSDEKTGEFTLLHVPSGSFAVNATTKEGMKGSTPIVIGATDVDGVVVKLEPRASLSGRVVDAKGAAVSDVTVHLSGAASRKPGTQDIIDSFRGTRTRADGSFSAVGLDGGTYKLEVKDAYGPIAWASPADKDKPTEPIEIVIAEREAKTGVTLTIEARDGTIKGVAIGPDGKPAADVWITPTYKPDANENAISVGDGQRIINPFGAAMKPVLTGADGRFTIDRLRKGTYKLVGRLANGSAQGELDDVSVGSTVTLKLARLGELAGVVTSGGAPVAAYEIVCERESANEVRKRVSDPKGAYRFERLPPGEYTCTVDAEAGFGTAKISVPAGPATLDLVLKPWATLRGRVVSVLGGGPVAGVKVFAANPEAGTTMTSQIESLVLGTTPTTDANGGFVVSRVTPGPGKVRFLPAKGGFTELAVHPYTVAEGQTLDLGTIKIIPPRDGDAGTLGMTTVAQGSDLVVENVADGGPAAAAGIKAGDKITAINGQDVATITADVASKALASGTIGVGVRIQLAIDRAGAPVQVAVTSVKW